MVISTTRRLNPYVVLSPRWKTVSSITFKVNFDVITGVGAMTSSGKKGGARELWRKVDPNPVPNPISNPYLIPNSIPNPILNPKKLNSYNIKIITMFEFGLLNNKEKRRLFYYFETSVY